MSEEFEVTPQIVEEFHLSEIVEKLSEKYKDDMPGYSELDLLSDCLSIFLFTPSPFATDTDLHFLESEIRATLNRIQLYRSTGRWHKAQNAVVGF